MYFRGLKNGSGLQVGVRALRTATVSLAAVMAAVGASCGQSQQGGQSNDEEYGRKIHEYTTEKFFLTDLVDHLPASTTVPSPDKILGHIVGAPNYLTYSKDIYRY